VTWRHAGNKFPASFESTVRKLLRLQVHVLSHLYRSHWQHLVDLQLHPHFNTLVLHVMLFAKQFDLVDVAKDADMVLLQELFERLRRHSSQLHHAAAAVAHLDTDAQAPPPSSLPLRVEPDQQSDTAVHSTTQLSS